MYLLVAGSLSVFTACTPDKAAETGTTNQQEVDSTDTEAAKKKAAADKVAAEIKAAADKAAADKAAADKNK